MTLKANLVPGSAPIRRATKSYARRCTPSIEMAQLVLLVAMFGVVMEITVEEVSVRSWNDLMMAWSGASIT
jgi:hypothetical protein